MPFLAGISFSGLIVGLLAVIVGVIQFRRKEPRSTFVEGCIIAETSLGVALIVFALLKNESYEGLMFLLLGLLIVISTIHDFVVPSQWKNEPAIRKFIVFVMGIVCLIVGFNSLF